MDFVYVILLDLCFIRLECFLVRLYIYVEWMRNLGRWNFGGIVRGIR